MSIIVFSKDQNTLDYLKKTTLESDNKAVFCHSFTDLGEKVSSPHDVLVFHLLSGEEEEKIFYQFIDLYQQADKILVLTNGPIAEQGMRVYRAGARGYANTYMNQEKLSTAIKVIRQKKVWMGGEVLRKLLDCGVKVKQQSTPATKEKITASVVQQEKKSGLVSGIFNGIKKLFK